MLINARARLIATTGEPWPVNAMPEVYPDEYESDWFASGEFERLRPDRKLFEYNGCEIWGFKEPGSSSKFFVALDLSGVPQYVNEVFPVSVRVSTDLPGLTLAHLNSLRFWIQGSVAYRDTNARANLKGLATKIFWDYLASNGNAAITDSQQSEDAKKFWQRLLTKAWYLPVVVDPSYTYTNIDVVGGAEYFVERPQLQVEVKRYWRPSRDGRLLRVILTKDKP